MLAELRLAPLLVLAAIGLSVGCGDDDAATGSTSPTATLEPTTTTDIDPLTGLPRSFPSDFPVLTETTVSRASEYSDRYVIEWRTDDTLDDAVAFFEDELARPPWTTEGTRTDDNATIFDFAGGSSATYEGTLAVADLDSGVRILLNLIRE